jgi:glycosyltransferase involved in cell wall biosynthesis
MELSIIVPVYNEERNVPEFLRRVQPILQSCVRDYEIIFCLDPSTDRTQEIILEERKTDPSIKLLAFSRRFGQPMASLGGLQYSKGDAAIVMDVDLQDPPEIIPEMVAKWKAGFDVVLAQRRHRTGEPWIKNVVAAVGYHVINKIANVEIPTNTGDYRLMSRRVVEEINRLKESHGFLRGLVAIVGFRQTVVQFDRPPRFAGKTKYNPFYGSIRIGFNGIFCFSTYALSLCTQMGFVIAGLSFLMAAIYCCMKLTGTPFPLGNPTIVILILFLGGIQLISTGILGEYIGRIYEEVKQRPKFIVDQAIGFD